MNFGGFCRKNIRPIGPYIYFLNIFKNSLPIYGQFSMHAKLAIFNYIASTELSEIYCEKRRANLAFLLKHQATLLGVLLLIFATEQRRVARKTVKIHIFYFPPSRVEIFGHFFTADYSQFTQ
jgi:hypothetical protein